MSWGPCYFYYCCDACGKRFKYAADMIPVLGDRFGCCPDCGRLCTSLKDGAAAVDDLCYEEVEE